MTTQTPIINWATTSLASHGYTLQQAPEILIETPWSNVIRFSTSQHDIYLKQMPPDISLDPKIIQLLMDQCHASVPVVIDINEELHCFL